MACHLTVQHTHIVLTGRLKVASFILLVLEELVTFESLLPFCFTTARSTSWCIQTGLAVTTSMNLPKKFAIWRILLCPNSSFGFFAEKGDSFPARSDRVFVVNKNKLTTGKLWFEIEAREILALA